MATNSESDQVNTPEAKRPEKLYRAFTIHPSNLTLELFKKPLQQGSGLDPETKTRSDGNESGIYMTTNKSMADRAYAHSSHLMKCPRYNSGRGIMDFIELPNCGVTVEIDTAKLAIRKPKITPALTGVYNNGFSGEEWIADDIPPSSYKVSRLTLSTHSNDRDRLVVDVEHPDELEPAISKIKTAYEEKLAAANKFVAFLNTLDESPRLNQFCIEKAWEAYQKEN